MNPIKLKSLDEVLDRFKELVHRHRRRFLRRNLSPCPYNCKKAEVVGRDVVGCRACGSSNPDFCKRPEKFVPLHTKEELSEQFRKAMRDPNILLRDYRDIVVMLWVTSQLPEPGAAVSEQIMDKVEKHD